MTTQYLVTWSINLDADTPRAAAEAAQRIQRSYASTVNVFRVRIPSDRLADAVEIDLNISAYEAAKTTLIEALSQDMEKTLLDDKQQRETFAKEGFEGFGNMSRQDLKKAAEDAGLDSNTHIAQAIEALIY